MKLVFSSNNRNKIKEIQQLLESSFDIVSIEEIGCLVDIPETAPTLEGNASLKSRYVYENYGLNCFSDDTGLEIEALNGAPGVYSARYAGDHKSSSDNMNKVLSQLENIENRKARFRTVISLIFNGIETQFEGIVNGVILTAPKGEEGFGYDPIFQPDGYEVSLAELTFAEKNKISHRALAIVKLTKFLKRIDEV